MTGLVERGWFWHPERVGVPGIVEIPMPHGARWWADVLAPRGCVAFHAPSVSALVALSQLFGKRWREVLIAAAPLGAVETTAEWAPPPVAESWARLVVVRGVRQWMPYPVDDIALPIDEAIGWHLAGHPEMAGLSLAPVAPALADLVVAKQEGMLPQFACLDVELAVTIAKDVLAETNPDRLLIEDAEEHGPAAPLVSDEGLMSVLAEWSSRLMALEPAGALSLSPADAEPNRYPVDLRSVTARLLEWHGPEHREVRAVRDGNGIRVECHLAEGTEPTDWEVTKLRAYAARRDSGEVLGSAPLMADDRTRVTGLVTAQIALEGDVDLDALVVGVGQDDIETRPRLDPAGHTLLEVDRRLVATWASHRLSHVSGRVADAMVPGQASAADHVLDARVLLDFAAGDAVRPMHDFAKQRVGVAEQLVKAASHAGWSPEVAAERPLLAELIPGLPDLATLPSFRQ